MTFGNPIVGGGKLVIPGIQSPNYVAGLSGWRIARDGTVELNVGIFRGSLSSGTDPGKHTILNNPATGDAVDIYDSGNNLVYCITKDGAAESISSSTGQRATIFDGALQLLNTNFFTDFFNSEASPFLPSSQPKFLIDVSGSGDDYLLIIEAGSADGTQLPTLTGSERNIQGSILQSDTVGYGNLIHAGTYTATVSGTGGMATFNHGCLFTPKGGVAGPLKHFSQWNWNDAFGGNGTGFNASQAQITMYQPNGTALTSGSPGLFYAWFWG